MIPTKELDEPGLPFFSVFTPSFTPNFLNAFFSKTDSRVGNSTEQAITWALQKVAKIANTTWLDLLEAKETGFITVSFVRCRYDSTKFAPEIKHNIGT